jgi:lipopolysaccharide export system permease protein
MKVIERYIFWRVFVVFAAALAWTLTIVWTTQVLTRIDLVTDKAQTALTFFEIASLILPAVAPMVIPFALLIGITLTLGAMNTDSELPVINAAGASRSVVIRPILLLAGLASIASFTIDNGIDPYARERYRTLIAEARGDLLSLVLQEGTFRKVEDGLFVQVGQRLPDGDLGQIFVSDSREEGVDLVYYAKRGTVAKQNDKSVLLMFDGVLNRKTPDGQVSLVRFTSYAFDLAAFSNGSSGVRLYPKDRGLRYLINPDPNDPIYQTRPQSFVAELHRRLIEWLYPIAFALIGIAVAGDARSHREARIHPLITASVIALVWRWAGYFTIEQLKTTPWMVIAAYASPIVPALMATWFIRNHRTMELPISTVEWVAERARGAYDRVTGVFGRRMPAGGSA